MTKKSNSSQFLFLELHRNKEKIKMERKSCPIIALGQLFHTQASWGERLKRN